MTNLISWFSVFDFTKTVKQAGDRIFSSTSICQKSSQYGVILQSYCTGEKGAIFYASQCTTTFSLPVTFDVKIVAPATLVSFFGFEKMNGL